MFYLRRNGEVYNIADEDSNITIRQLAELIAGLVGRKVIMKCPDDLKRKVIIWSVNLYFPLKIRSVRVES